MKQQPILLERILELALKDKGYNAICGVDEAGRGPLAGDVVAAAVILPWTVEYPGLNDSKKMTPKARERLYEHITQTAIWAIGTATPAEIDTLNILNATMLAMQRAVQAMPYAPDYALIDGNIARGFAIPHQTVVGGDGISPSIAAASVIAKVTRDRMCLVLDQMYPDYLFAKHKGYATKEHMQLLRTLGPTAVHRRSFLSFLNKNDAP